ncbi:hypothetical protein ACVR05_03155 [Streptococcus caprae]|uniref:DUF308 domain-containing protein n=1 Tax=Streptococcus caprae TaxID=1640501 RepID=A0ABV8CXQ5_9STRE
MKKLSELGLTGKKLVFQGILLTLLGLILVFTGVKLPTILIKLFVYGLLALGGIDMLLRVFKKIPSQEPIVVSILKLAFLLWLAGTDMVTDVPLYLFGLLMAVYQIFSAAINLITYALYVKDSIRPRMRLLIDGIWLAILGFSTLLASNANANFQFLYLGLYLIFYGLSNLRDGLFFEKELGKNSLKRRVRVPLPLAVAALIPLGTLNKINAFLLENSEETASEAYDIVKENSGASDMTVFVHVAQDGVHAVGHLDFAYRDKVYGFGSYDPSSEHLFGAMGDGVLFTAKKEEYIRFCNQDGLNLLAYDLVLSEEQKTAVEQKIREIEEWTYTWQPSADLLSKDKDGNPQPIYAYQLQSAIGGQFFKFKSSKFKSYFVLSTNCVLLVDSVLGSAGTAILSPKGFIAPGTYQAYLDREFEKPHSLVIGKKVYQASPGS